MVFVYILAQKKYCKEYFKITIKEKVVFNIVVQLSTHNKMK